MSGTDLSRDASIVRATLALHPGLYRYLSQSGAAERLAKFERSFAHAHSLEARVLSLSRVLSEIRCGHTYVNPANQSGVTASALYDRATRLPFEFLWLRNEMIVTRPFDEVPEIDAGAAVKRIDGRPTGELLATLLPYVRADGHNDAKRRSLLSVQGLAEVETFDVLQSLLAAPIGRRYVLHVESADGEMRRLEVPAITLGDRQRQRRTVANDGSPTWTWDVRPDGIVLLTMPSWAMYKSGWKGWRSWLSERLDSLAGSKGLIIDLRDNEGGDPCGDEILARAASADIHLESEQQRIRFRRTPAELDRYLDTWDASFRTLGVDAVEVGDGFFARPDVGDAQVIAAIGPKITVPLAALIGPVNSSATFQFAQRAQRLGLVELFGSETGGNLRGINGGAFFFVRLPSHCSNACSAHKSSVG